ncbi:MAG: S24 family peptidase [Actinomycetota bacterium]|nr:S24 family peptidase [Actinomycetota bacterium]
MHKIQKQIISIAKQGIPIPSLRILGKLTGADHPQKIKHHLGQLEKKNILRYDPKTKRLILLSDQLHSKTGLLSLPIYGSANCGQASCFADDYVEGYLKISKKLLSGIGNLKDLFIVEASGDSMNRANIKGNNIEDGDFVIVDGSVKKPENGFYVVSVLDGLANIKKFYQDKDSGQIALMQESTKNYPPIYIDANEIDQYIVSGRVIQVIKKPKLK